MPGDFMPNGISFSCIEDQMAVLVVETQILRENGQALLLRACHGRERSEAIQEKYCLYERKLP